MKNQNDLIIAIVCVVLLLGFGLGFYLTRPTVSAPPAPATVPLGEPTVQEGTVVRANSLPGGSTATGANTGAGGAGAGAGGGTDQNMRQQLGGATQMAGG